jgi:hypothetical protein
VVNLSVHPSNLRTGMYSGKRGNVGKEHGALKANTFTSDLNSVFINSRRWTVC